MKRPRDHDGSHRYVVHGLQGQTYSPVFDDNDLGQLVASLKT
ncbi:hypothetical protein [Limnohabitans sp.]